MLLSASLRRLRPAGLAASILLAAAAAVGLAALAQTSFDLSARYTTHVALAFGAAAALIAALAVRHVGARAFGVANQVTLLRAVMIAVLFGLSFETSVAARAWLAVAIGAAVLVLDGVDGKLARRFGCASRFGARFDMETDTVLILGLSALAWQWEKAGVWILSAGLMRYLFVLTGRLLPWMRRALPVSRRRQTICVIQAVALLASISPLFPTPASDIVALAGLATLAGSFLVDVAWLVRNRPVARRRTA